MKKISILLILIFISSITVGCIKKYYKDGDLRYFYDRGYVNKNDVSNMSNFMSLKYVYFFDVSYEGEYKINFEALVDCQNNYLYLDSIDILEPINRSYVQCTDFSEDHKRELSQIFENSGIQKWNPRLNILGINWSVVLEFKNGDIYTFVDPERELFDDLLIQFCIWLEKQCPGFLDTKAYCGVFWDYISEHPEEFPQYMEDVA